MDLSLKAARWVAGGVRASDTGKSGYEVFALSPKELASRGLAENKISADILSRIERLERETSDIEVAAIAKALGVNPAWLRGKQDGYATELAGLIEQLLDAYGRATGKAPPQTDTEQDDTDHPDESDEAAGA